MKRQFRYIAAIVFAISAFSCTRYEELDGYVPAPGETVKLTLAATKGSSKASTDTRVHVGEVKGNTVRYHWTDDDQIGVIPFLADAHPNYVTKESQINPDDNNQAQFEAYITAEGYDTPEVDLLIYYPYNSSMLEGVTGNTGAEFAAQGFTFRLPQEQDQHGYSRDLDFDASQPRIKWHPSDWALSTYGLAYDLATSNFSSDVENGQTTAHATGEFQLDHANTYFQFNVYGSQSLVNPQKHYGDGTWKVTSITVQAGNCEMTIFDGEPVYNFTEPVTIAGTYTFRYDYKEADFDNVDKNNNNENIKLESKAGVNSIRVSMHDVQNAPSIGKTAEESVPAFAVINPMGIKDNETYPNTNCLKVAVTLYQYDEDKNIVGSDIRIRYYNISSLVGTDIAGNYYTIDFEVCDPVESYTDLSEIGTANCYVIGAPGNYSFDASVAGNGKAPYLNRTMGIDPANLLPQNQTEEDDNYGIDWLWASGLSFDDVAKNNSGLSDEEIVKKIINSVSLSGKEGQVSVGLGTGLSTTTLSGNVVLALYEKKPNGSAGDIVWTWHLWLGKPETQHYHFSATNSKFQYTNEDWYMMDRNLGAESNKLGDPRSTGLYYQSGRKEPIIGFAEKDNAKEWADGNRITTYANKKVFDDRAEWTAGMSYSNYNTLRYPMALVSAIPNEDNTSDYHFAWTSSQVAEVYYSTANDTKSIFDPCPPGYRLPTVREWDNLKAEKYLWITGGYESGAFGYCLWKELAPEFVGDSDERTIDYAKRIAGGDFYTVNDEYEREYHIVRSSGTGSEVVTNFPNTGVLLSDGQWMHIKEEGNYKEITKIEHGQGPELTATIASSTSYQVETPAFSSIGFVTDLYVRVFYAESDVRYLFSTAEETDPDNPQYRYLDNFHQKDEDGKYTDAEKPVYDSSNDFAAYSGNVLYAYRYDNYAQQWSNATVVTIGSGTVSCAAGDPISTELPWTELTVSFNDASGQYFYSAVDLLTRVDIPGSTITISCESLSYNALGNVSLYFCQTDGSVATAPTEVVVTKNADGTYSVATTRWGSYSNVTGGEYIDGERATSALWTSGRIDSSDGQNYFYSTYWFGPGELTTYGWTAKNENGEYHVLGNTGQAPAPFHERRATYGLEFNPVAINIYKTGYGNANEQYPSPYYDNDPAVPTRCIREYDNVSTPVVSE